MGSAKRAGRKALDRQLATSVQVFRDESGVVAVFAAILFVVLLALSAIVVDYGYVLMVKAQARTAADAGALAAASHLPGDMTGAQAAAAESVALNLSGATALVTPGFEGDPHQVEVQVAAVAPTFFARIFGVNSVDVAARAVAELSTITNRTPLQVMIVQDASGSFTEEWAQAINADRALANLINEVSVQGDQIGFVAFSEGLKSTTNPGVNRALGTPRMVNAAGDTDALNGQVVTLQWGLSDLDYAGHSTLPGQVSGMFTIASKDSPGGYTHPEGALNWAVDQLEMHGQEGSDHVIVFVSDGMPNPDAEHRPPTILAARRAGQAGIRMHTVTLTNEPTGGSYGTTGADYQFNKDLVEKYDVGPDGISLGGSALATSDPGQLRTLLVAIATTELTKPHLVK